jgi:exonuclease SbcD
MRFIHTADWHMGRRLNGESFLPAQRQVLEQLIQFAHDERPDAILISGDLYDRAVPPPDAVEALNDIFVKLQALNIPVIVIAGNHDSAERLAFLRQLLRHQNLHITGWPEADSRPLELHDEWGAVHFHSVPFAEPAVVRARLGASDVHTFDEAMAACLKPVKASLDPNARHVLLAHGSVLGARTTPSSERRLTLQGPETIGTDNFEGFHYVALGHLHEPQHVPDHESIRYSGSIMKYCFDEEAQTKGFLVVDMDGAGKCRAESQPLRPPRELRRIQGLFRDLLESPEQFGRHDDYLSVTLLDDGRIKDAMTLLRQRFPNILQLHYLDTMTPNTQPRTAIQRETTQLGQLELFQKFYQDVYDQTLDEQQLSVLTSIIEQREAARQERQA